MCVWHGWSINVNKWHKRVWYGWIRGGELVERANGGGDSDNDCFGNI